MRMVLLFVGCKHLFFQDALALADQVETSFFSSLNQLSVEEFQFHRATCILVAAEDPFLSAESLSLLPEWASIILVGSSPKVGPEILEDPRVSVLSDSAEWPEVKAAIQVANAASKAAKEQHDRREQALSRFRQLTPRELEVIKLFAAGLSTPKVACDLEISESTVDKHRRSAFQKLNVEKNVLEALNDLIDVPTLLRDSISE